MAPEATPEQGCGDHQDEHADTEEIGVFGLQIDGPEGTGVNCKQPFGLAVLLVKDAEHNTRDRCEDQGKGGKGHQGTRARWMSRD